MSMKEIQGQIWQLTDVHGDDGYHYFYWHLRCFFKLDTRLPAQAERAKRMLRLFSLLLYWEQPTSELRRLAITNPPTQVRGANQNPRLGNNPFPKETTSKCVKCESFSEWSVPALQRIKIRSAEQQTDTTLTHHYQFHGRVGFHYPSAHLLCVKVNRGVMKVSIKYRYL